VYILVLLVKRLIGSPDYNNVVNMCLGVGSLVVGNCKCGVCVLYVVGTNQVKCTVESGYPRGHFVGQRCYSFIFVKYKCCETFSRISLT
jgi:hypothetical protein